MIKAVKLFLPAGVLLFALSSCTSVAKLVCKPWQITDVKFNGQTGVFTDEQRRSIEYQLKNELSFRFLPDSSYLMIKDRDTSRGVWYLSADKKQVITKLYGGEESISEIISINKREFLMRPQNFGEVEYIKATLPTDTK